MPTSLKEFSCLSAIIVSEEIDKVFKKRFYEFDFVCFTEHIFTFILGHTLNIQLC